MEIYRLFKVPMYRKWTSTAVFCYKRGCNCKDCPIQEIIEEECQMKYSVMMLVKNIGKPKGDKNV